ncbi:type IV secretion system DNA-binding domain-containing protein [Candidatus Nomurabacteria bacterium]|nr:type IV secretion system DNA-binding domain-containing protein [Candidatus Nomurabacteria bacterium]
MELPEIPVNKDVTYLGITTYRDKNQLFGIKRKDRRQHVYILGKSGTGKSVLMFNMIIQNIQNGEGVCMVDPHGENVEAILSAIPRHRLKDVVYFNPADTDYHIGFNVLELIDPQYKHLVASGLMGIFTKIWANAWSARMEYILNNTILALLDTPGTTLLGIPRMLVDKDYRQKIISNLKDPVIKAFWVHEYEAWQDKFRNEAIAPIQNKVGQFLSTSIIRNVVGQTRSTINIFDMMNEGKIFLVNVSKGRIGEDNSALLGGMIITKIQLAAMERVRIPEEHRKDFYLYVDEFQNFVTDAFAGILSEARKYRLNLTVAHQYTAQLISDKSSAVRDAVFGNVGTIIVFRVGADDADFLEKEFEPEFVPQDIVNLPNYKVYMKLMIDGVTSRPFSAKTLPQMVKGGDRKIEQEVIESSRKLYCKSKEDVEREINNWSGMSLGDMEPSGVSSAGYVGGQGSMEKFQIICSLCGLEKTVPFKPEPGRPVYCKECIAKIKSGEVKVEKGSENQIKYDDSKFYKPLADLGIEFAPKEGKIHEEKERYPERAEHKQQQQPPASKSGIFNAVKKVFHSKPPVVHKDKPSDHSALKEVLSKALQDTSRSAPQPSASAPSPISLDTLKDKMRDVKQETVSRQKDRAATPEDMNKLKNLIAQKTPTPAPVSQKTVPPEVPEDVLRKILE